MKSALAVTPIAFAISLAAGVMLTSSAVRAAIPGADANTDGPTHPAAIDRPHSCDGFYPEAALRDDREGTTVLGFTIRSDGSVSNIKVTKSSGQRLLDDAASRCVSLWHYRPSMRQGRPVAAAWAVKVQWKLRADVPAFPPVLIATACLVLAQQIFTALLSGFFYLELVVLALASALL